MAKPTIAERFRLPAHLTALQMLIDRCPSAEDKKWLIITAGSCEAIGRDEGFLTLAQALGRSVWVSAGTSMLPRMELADVTRAVVIGADGDAAGETAATKAAHAFAAVGRKVRIMRPATGFKDFNAELMKARS